MARAIAEELGAPIHDDAALRVMVRIDNDTVTVSLDHLRESLHKRGFKEAVAKAPMRETMASLFLRQDGFDGTQPIVDPNVRGRNLRPRGCRDRRRSQTRPRPVLRLRTSAMLDAEIWNAMRAPVEMPFVDQRFFGSDRDPGAIRMAEENAARAGLCTSTRFDCRDIADLVPPDTEPGIVIVNPPYGTRIGNKAPLVSLYRALGAALKSGFSGWRGGRGHDRCRSGRATGLKPEPAGPSVLHGGVARDVVGCVHRLSRHRALHHQRHIDSIGEKEGEARQPRNAAAPQQHRASASVTPIMTGMSEVTNPAEIGSGMNRAVVPGIPAMLKCSSR